MTTEQYPRPSSQPPEQAAPAVSRPTLATARTQRPASRRVGVRHLAGVCMMALGLTSCGGVDNPSTIGGQKLSFFYYQNCINPIFDKLLPIVGTSLTNTCSGSGCHDNVAGTGGAFRIVPQLNPVTDYVDPAQAPATIRATNMSKNFYSSQGETDISTPGQSRLIIKPLVQGVLHGGGQIFPNDQDQNVKLIRYWITHPVPEPQDEFSTGPAVANMFTPPIDFATFNPSTFNPASCNTQ